jgi:hypothetical protein
LTYAGAIPRPDSLLEKGHFSGLLPSYFGRSGTASEAFKIEIEMPDTVAVIAFNARN